MLCGAEGGAICFTFSILRIFTGRFGGFGLVCVCLFCFVLVWPVEILHSVSVSLFCGFPVVDRPCPVLARQCRKKKKEKKPKVAIAYFFTSHDNIHHVRVYWGTLPLLLFSDLRVVYPVDVYQFQGQAVHRLNQQHIQLGLRKGMTVLVYYRVQARWSPCERDFSGCPHCTRVGYKSGKANGKQAVETGCPIRD